MIPKSDLSNVLIFIFVLMPCNHFFEGVNFLFCGGVEMHDLLKITGGKFLGVKKRALLSDSFRFSLLSTKSKEHQAASAASHVFK